MGAKQAIGIEAEERPVRHRLTVRDFLILDEAGVFGDQRVELVEGEIFVLSPVFLPHSRTLWAISIAVGEALERSGLVLWACTPVSAELEEHSLPEADILLVDPGKEEGFVQRGAIRLAVEVSDGTLRHDLVRKARLYTRAGIPEYWVVDVRGRRIVRMVAPENERYTATSEFAFGEPVDSATLPGLVVDTRRLAELG